MPCRLSYAFIVCLLGASVSAAQTAVDAQRNLVIRDVALIDGSGAPPRPHTNVVVVEGHVVCIGSGAACAVPAGAKVIDGAGRWLIPGLFDAHVHVSEEHGRFGPLYLAFGVTSVRDLGGYADSLRALRAAWGGADNPGPRLYMAGRPIDGDPPQWPFLYPAVPRIARTAEEARVQVREAKAEGAEFIKLYGGLSVPALRAAIAEAHAEGLKATADLLAWAYSPDSAVAAGLDGFEHTVIPPGPPDSSTWRTWPKDSMHMDALLDRMVRQQVVLSSTLVIFERWARGRGSETEPTYQALPPALRKRSAEMLAAVNPQLAYACRTVRMFHAKGGVIFAGSDSFFGPVYPGDLHRELELLVSCGLSPGEALAAGSRNPAAWLGADSVGTIAVGKVADFVLLRADPLADVRHTREIDLVVTRGQPWRPAALLAEAQRN